MAKEYYSIIKYPLSTEKAIDMIKRNNSITFVVEKSANKKDIKSAIEVFFKKKVKAVNTTIRFDGRKIAHVSFPHDTPASDIATILGIL